MQRLSLRIATRFRPLNRQAGCRGQRCMLGYRGASHRSLPCGFSCRRLACIRIRRVQRHASEVENSMRLWRCLRGRHLGGHFEGGKQRRGAVSLVIVTMSGQRPPVRKLQIALGALQRLDRGFFVNADDDRDRAVPGRARSQRRPRRRTRDGRSRTRTSARRGRIFGLRRKRQTTAYRHRRSPPPTAAPTSGRARRRRLMQRQDVFARAVYFGSGRSQSREARNCFSVISHTPLRGRAGRAPDRPSNRSARHAVRCQEIKPHKVRSDTHLSNARRFEFGALRLR